ncbi:MAG TPA: hypothetical protein VJV77_07810 [Casimicrobiaceae bacterium]|nr:hypothetical protein [Casimicrobiaceae bacterium]
MNSAVPSAVRVAGVGISHPERVVAEAPGHTKLDVVHYHEQMGPWLVPQLAPRPIASPPGAGESAPPFIRVADTAGVVRAVQNGHYEFRTWGACFPRLERPDRIVLGLGGADVSWTVLREAAQQVRALLESLDLPPFLKTTGGSGLDVVVAITRRHKWTDVAEFAQAVARRLVRSRPALFAAGGELPVAGRVVVDTRGNDLGHGAVAAYSLRARAGLPVSMPIAWSDLGAVDLRGSHFEIDGVPAFVAARRDDPWAVYEQSRRTLSAAMRRALM